MRWEGFRKVRAQVCKRVARRMHQARIESVADYRAYLETHPKEWEWLGALSHVTISRFYRDKAVFALLEGEILPALARLGSDRGQSLLRVWSIGCCSGEEPYTIALIWKLQLQPQYPNIGLAVIATDIDQKVIQRAKAAYYPYSSVKALPLEWQHKSFEHKNNLFYLKPEYQIDVGFIEQDVRVGTPCGMFDLVLCRNLVFTYFDAEQQHKTLAQIHKVIKPGGVLVIGAHENLPKGAQGFSVYSEGLKIFRKLSV